MLFLGIFVNSLSGDPIALAVNPYDFNTYDRRIIHFPLGFQQYEFLVNGQYVLYLFHDELFKALPFEWAIFIPGRWNFSWIVNNSKTSNISSDVST